MLYFLVRYVVACVGYGWCLQKGVNISIPLILHVISESLRLRNYSLILRLYAVGFAVMTILTATQTLLVDLLPGLGSSVSACVRPRLPFHGFTILIIIQNNFVRCSLGAALISVIDIMINHVGMGWTYVILGALCVAVTPMMYLVIYIGPRWRARRRARDNN